MRARPITYDNYGRLATSNQTSNGSAGQRRFAYDRWGNRTGMWQNFTQLQSINLQTVAFPGTGSAPTNRITSVTGGTTVNYTYDANGDVTNDGVHSYSYDSENRLANVDGGATASYAYDHQNRRYKKTVGGSVTHYVWEGTQVAGEYNGGTGAMQAYYGYVGTRLFLKGGSSTQVLLGDQLGVRLALSDAGIVVGRQGRLPFGEDFAESGTQEKHHFGSYERDIESGADYALTREYSNAVGRFMSVDPIFDAGFKVTPFGRFAKKTIESILVSPQELNRYNYCVEDPVGKSDPTGLGWRKVLYCALKVTELLGAIYTYYASMAALIAACPETIGLSCIVAFIISRVALAWLADAAIDVWKACRPGEALPGSEQGGGDGGGWGGGFGWGSVLIGGGTAWDDCSGDFWMANAACEFRMFVT